MDDNRTIDRKSTNGGVRKVRCPRCKNLLIEPTDIPLYRCGICGTVLQAKHYKGPPVHVRHNLTTSNSISSHSTASNESSEVNGLVEKSESLFLGEQNCIGERSVGAGIAKDEVPINGNGRSDSNSERSLEIGKSDGEERTTVVVSSGQLQKSTVLNTSGLEKSSSLPASAMEKPVSSEKESPQIESPEGGPEADGSMQKHSLILEANEFKSKYPHSSSGRNSPARSESIHPGVDISNNGSKIDEQVTWTDSESMHPIEQQNLPVSNTNDNSAKDELPRINYHPDFNSEQCLPAVSGCEDQENKKETVNLSELVDKSSDLEVDVSESKGDLSASCGSGPTASGNLSPPDNIKEEAVTQIVETIALKEIVSELGSGPHSSSGQQCHEKEIYESQENATEHTSSSIHMVKSISHGSSEMENARSSSVEGRCIMQSVEIIAPKGIVSEPSGSHHSSSRQQGQDMRENYESQENEAAHTSSSMPVVEGLSHASYELENAGQVNVQEGHIESFDDAIVAEVHTVDRFVENRANKRIFRNEQAKERGSVQERCGLEPVGSFPLNPNEPYSRNTHGSFQRYPSDLSKDFHSMQNWIEYDREKLGHLSRLSDSTELDRERMEILSKIDELRCLLESRTPTKDWNRVPPMEDGTRRSPSTISGSEYKYPQSLPSFSRWPSSTLESRTSFADENQYLQRTQPPRASRYGMRYSPHQFPTPTPCIPRNYRTFCSICSRHSDNDALPCNLHPKGSQMERLHRRERDHDFKCYCRPILGATHFLSCYECLKVLQIPEDFNFSSSRYKQLRCGACLEILQFSVSGKNQIVPCPPEARQSTEMSVTGNSQRGQVSYSDEEHSQSLDRSHSTEGEHVHYVSRDSGVNGRRRRRATEQAPLHKLLGYFSATDIMCQEKD